MTEQLKILILIKRFDLSHPKHKIKMDIINAIEEYAQLCYWYEDGDIKDILKEIPFTPDFIFHYDIAWNYALSPNITGLENVNIPKGCYVIDLHWDNKKRIQYFNENKIDLVFSVSKHPFLAVFPQLKNKLRWLPWSINPLIIKDWKEPKSIDYLLLGLVWAEDLKVKPQKGRYQFRDLVLDKMRNLDNFVFHPHPGHNAKENEKLLINEKYAKEINKAKIFFTCGCTDNLGGFAVLKFFEVPGCRSLLLAEPNREINDLGFVDGDNFVACSRDNFYEKAEYYLSNSNERERITNNGYEFIHSQHTNQIRAKQFVQMIQDFL
ncbi:glycosyltransferase [Alkalihalophilus marmarensis]|uniref:Spore protein YkvP/CgeB glycosyl transferase-like domain-containing protein n=1 Tax=Alkalihalophilus marmarensis DSM 21297 TaxID=1188261 RepID=U6SMS3_9BACI|nr:glycosyltransferase [Alkalihalophilus marmarensis]ERN52878.1 hypothetical protein A33I_14440 [Alkalihalophilus marmarensis DSM 21297]MCM3489131.1 glycosyltransferase [Alkalihalophilus marmarensis]